MNPDDQPKVSDDEQPPRITESSSSPSPIIIDSHGGVSSILSSGPEVTASSSPRPALSPNLASTSSSSQDPEEDSRRSLAKKLIERYFYQLSRGCGNPKCANRNCASSGGVPSLTANQAAARAIQLYTNEAELCDLHPSKIARTQNEESMDTIALNAEKDFAMAEMVDKEEGDEEQASSSRQRLNTTRPCATSGAPSSSRTYMSTSILPSSLSAALRNATANSPSPSEPAKPKPTDDYLDEPKLNKILEECVRDESYTQLIRVLGRYFMSRESLAASFQKRPQSAHIDALLERAPADLKNLKKEDFRTLEGDLDKDEDDSDEVVEPPPEPHYTSVDLVSLRRVMQRLYEVYMLAFESINTAVHSLALGLTVDLQFNLSRDQIEEVINVFVIVFEVMAIWSADFMDHALPAICRAVSLLPVWAQARLARIWAMHCPQSLQNILHTLQQLISLQVIACSDTHHFFVQDNDHVVWATKVMKIVYFANLLAGKMEPAKFREEEDDPEAAALSAIPEEEELFYGYNSKQSNTTAQFDDELASELHINVLDCRRPKLPFEEFYNEPLSDAIEMDNDYLNYKNRRIDQRKFSFMLYSFILTPATKTLALYYDNRIRMYSERRISIFHTELAGQPQNPYLKLKVRREQIIDDALIGLEVVAMGNPKDLKKQLVVEFVGEQGIDEGGVSKEFFQLVVEQIFNPDYGMFVQNESTNTCWFNSTSFENEAQFTLIGIVLGLAIYNNIILAVNFPMVVYRKLMGIRGSFDDLEDWNPEIYRSLTSLLAYEEPDMEEVFMLTFRINFADVFGNLMTYDLRPDGDSIVVCQDNKQEFVELYTDYLLNTSVEKQFRSFRRGFQMVTDESPLQLLFRPEEIELLVCGSKKFDFHELENATEYEGGFNDQSQTIVDFWDIVHALPVDSKKKLLEFTTGSDRVPVGGLSRLKLMIARNGPDSDRLPTSHTCFNVLLLPEYTDKEKLRDRLLKAINYSKGFGML